MSLTEKFLSSITYSAGYTYEKAGSGLVLIPSAEQQYYMPLIVIKDCLAFEQALIEYAKVIDSLALTFYRTTKEHPIEDYLFYLIKSLTNDDCSDLTSYVIRFTKYLKDAFFSQLTFKKPIGNLGEYKIIARKCEEYYGAETPFTMHYYLDKPGLRFEIPLIRYGITPDKKAYIYSVQRKRLYNNRNGRIKSINTLLNKVNSGVKEDRNITPAMLCSLTLFIGMLESEGIHDVMADGFLTRRYGYLDGLTNDDERDAVLSNSVDKFFRLFIRLQAQFKDIDISAYPFEVDSYMHIKLGQNIYSNNELLNELHNIGKTYKLTKKD